MKYKQGRKDKLQGEIHNIIKKSEPCAAKTAFNELNLHGDRYNWTDIIELIRLLFDLKIDVENYNFVYDTDLKFGIEDIIRGINRELNLKKYQSSNWKYKGGRPPKVRLYVNLWKSFHELGNQEKCDVIRYEAERELSRTSFWNFRKEIVRLFPEEEKWLF
jgi:hypothetical protein